MEVQCSVCSMPQDKSAYSTKSQTTSNFEFSERPHVKLMRNQLITSQRPISRVPHVCCRLDCIFFFFFLEDNSTSSQISICPSQHGGI